MEPRRSEMAAENKKFFVDIMLEEVLEGNCVGGKFTHQQWVQMTEKLNTTCPRKYQYNIKQVESKYKRLKTNWTRFYNVKNNAMGLGWDSVRGVIYSDEDAWKNWTDRNDQDRDLKKKSCLHYEELTTIFFGSTATGRYARASTQRGDVYASMGGHKESGVRQRHSYTLASLKKEQPDQKEQKEALLLLDAMELPDHVYKADLKTLRDAMANHMFLNVANDQKRHLLLEVWVEEDSRNR
ncbi:Unknown protein [Striga hermonthica]|uniref:Myb/SANT-like domain-containing protein n=1 Tax=Striga hermonthica TaxID=68872 RepID=A0A9N7MQV7_STRHE|nr:Unknown protein [Striga hermonthica]